MNKETRRLSEYLGHILQAISRIEMYTAGMDSATFMQNPMAQDAVLRNVEIIGEAARNVERHHSDTAAKHPEIPWEDIYLMRNRVSHGYFSVDLELVWKTLRGDLPELKRQVTELLGQTGR
ncbi:MAG: DUF86 domain-containing protein [Rhodocyclaceae bacterium]|nr:DUF86 domain-containing protein [Rhodocyclaceae bacterium]MCW5597360.1 DUF86 domain-containing protein [Rhodocyclaceae bacterium]PKO72841.1 MAG: hypothetical protein CVU20_00345 [Betaproteobacteria bacterium HGW-Betaproteobacteria-14]PKO94874.1 MAG: hypothetical protein CVU16_00125 [Betaproteobacteria bacterium HGW-Betaproteobacteria-10]